MDERPKRKMALDNAKERRFQAVFQAKYLHALEPFVTTGGDSFRLEGLFIEPCADGGVLLIATDGVSLAAIRDPDGRANMKMRASIPSAIFKACIPRPPVSLWCEGDNYERDLPEWSQPGWVWLWELSAVVLPVMPTPEDAASGDGRGLLAHESVADGNVYREDEYRLHGDDVALAWRRIVSGAPATADEPTWINPDKMAMFSRIFTLFGVSRGCGGIGMRTTGAGSAVVLHALAEPNFIGAIMPMKGDKEPAVPAWAREPSSGGGQK